MSNHEICNTIAGYRPVQAGITLFSTAGNCYCQFDCYKKENPAAKDMTSTRYTSSRYTHKPHKRRNAFTWKAFLQPTLRYTTTTTYSKKNQHHNHNKTQQSGEGGKEEAEEGMGG
jgi:hypothetical protein